MGPDDEDGIDLTEELDDDTIRSLFDSFEAEDWHLVDSIIDGIEPGVLEAAEAKAGGADRNRGGAEKLRRYWTRGPGGAKIAWGTEGDWTRCVAELSKHLGPRAKGYCTLRHKEMNGYYPGDKRNLKSARFDGDTETADYPVNNGTKALTDGAPMLEHKNVGVNGLKVLDAEQGIVETIISVTGIVDEVKDRIVPGAYAKTLASRKPKGVWSHDWDTPISRTLDVKEMLPGDPDLPRTTPKGDPWPADAGALMVKTQFNLETQRGREAYSDVVFFGADQEWSIGYNVPTGGARIDQKSGVREIQTLDLYEYSPVLFGAMPLARTTSVKEAQMAFKAIKSVNPEDVEVVEDVADAMDAEVVDDDDILDDIEEKGMGGGMMMSGDSMHLIQQAVMILRQLLNMQDDEEDDDDAEESEDAVSEDDMATKDYYEDMEFKENTYDSLKSAIESLDGSLDAEVFDALVEQAGSIDAAYDNSDAEALDSASDAYLDTIETAMKDADADTIEVLQAAADALAQMMEVDDEEAEPEGESEASEDEPAEPVATEGKSLIDTTQIAALRSVLDS